MKKWIWLFLLIVTLTGCKNSREEITLNKDGSGVYETRIFIPQGIILTAQFLIDKDDETIVLNNSDDNFQNQIGNSFYPKQTLETITSESKGSIRLDSYNRDYQKEGLKINYTLSFDNIIDFASKGITQIPVVFEKDQHNNWKCAFKGSKNLKQSYQGYISQYNDMLASENFKNLDPDLQKLMKEAAHSINSEMVVSMPFNIFQSKGNIRKLFSNKAFYAIKGNVLANDKVIDALSGMQYNQTYIIWQSDAYKRPEFKETLRQTTQRIRPVIPTQPRTKTPSYDGTVTFRLHNGNTRSGKIVEETEEYYILESLGLQNTYYKSDIFSIE